MDLAAHQYLTRQTVDEARKVHDKTFRGDKRTLCPAADIVSKGVYCKIEEQMLEPHQDPHTVKNFCCSEHTKCPTFILSKKEGGSTSTSFTEAARRAKAKAKDRDDAFLADFNERFGGK